MIRRVIHEWRDWLLEYISEDKYELIQKRTLSVHPIVANDTMDAENQCQQIVKKRIVQTTQYNEKGGGDNQK